MRYIGSKTSTAQEVLDVVRGQVPEGTFCDPFGGIGVVGSTFKAAGFQVYTGDVLRFAHYFQIARVAYSRSPGFVGLRGSLNLSNNETVAGYLEGLAPRSGWFTEQYARRRKFFTLENAKRIDACWVQIRRWWRQQLINERQRAFLLASLIESADKVANTAGTYYAYLKAFDRKALCPFVFRLLTPTAGSESCTSLLAPAEETVARRAYDVLYLDPPYNSRPYSRYYHLAETLAEGLTPSVHGRAGLPEREHPRSDFTRRETALPALLRILNVSKWQHLVLHYADDGLISPSEIRQGLRGRGRLREKVVTSRGYTTDATPRRVPQRLYIVTHA